MREELLHGLLWNPSWIEEIFALVQVGSIKLLKSDQFLCCDFLQLDTQSLESHAGYINY